MVPSSNRLGNGPLKAEIGVRTSVESPVRKENLRTPGVVGGGLGPRYCSKSKDFLKTSPHGGQTRPAEEIKTVGCVKAVIWRRSPTEEAIGLGPIQCGFESHRLHQFSP